MMLNVAICVYCSLRIEPESPSNVPSTGRRCHPGVRPEGNDPN